MRGARWLLLVAIAAILGGVGVTYKARKKTIREQAPPTPQALPPELNSTANDWTVSNQVLNRKIYDLSAKQFHQTKDSSRVDLEGVTLKLYNQDATSYDLVTSPAATLTTTDKRLHSDGEVEITLGMPAAGQPKHSLVSIKSSGISLDPETGRAETDRPATFKFQNGEGKATGAYYDPVSHDLVLKKDVEILWKAPGPHSTPLKIEAATAYYKESLSEIWLKPWGRLTRGQSVVEGEDDVIRLDKPDDGGQRGIRQVEANKAHGTDVYPNRKLQYAAGRLLVDFNGDGEVQKVTGGGDARLVSTSDAAETTVTAASVELNFDASSGESALSRVDAQGRGEIVSKPLPRAGRQLAETHVMRSDNISMTMRPGGKDIERVVTKAPGSVEFIPNQPAQHHRVLNGSVLEIAYGASNQIESFHATDAKTRTDPTAEEVKRGRKPFTTSSRDLAARFDPRTSRMTSIEQAGDFVYDESDRHARASKATLDSSQDAILLQTPARMWDAAGSTSADRIRLDQRTGDFTAEGNVRSSRLPDQGKKSSEMLSGSEPLQAQAVKMESRNGNRLIHYEGGAMMWQGANQVRADSIDVDRENRTLLANGNVTTILWEQPKTPAGKPAARPPAAVLTTVKAQRMLYTDAGRLADYTGGVIMTRAGLRVKAAEIKAYLAASGSDSSLEKALADGGVDILQTGSGRTRTGTGDHAEYYTSDQKVILRGAMARFVDGENSSQGMELTYLINDDSLRIDGAPNRPVQTQITRKRK